MSLVPLVAALRLLSHVGLSDGPAPAAMDCQTFSAPSTDYHYAVATATGDGAVDVAQALAQRELVERICGGQSCPAVESDFMLWQKGRLGDETCVMVTVQKAVVKRHLRRATGTAWLDATARDAAERLSRRLAVGRKPGESVSFMMGAIAESDAYIGGERVNFFADRLKLAFDAAGLMLVTAKARPEVVLDGRLNYRIEEGIPVVEVLLTAKLGKQVIPVEPILCAAEAIPGGAPASAPGSRSAHFADPAVDLSLRTGPGGRLCEGEQTQVTLTTTQDLHVRVFDLYGQGDALVMFPNEQVPSGFVKAGQPIALGGESDFDVIFTPGATSERYLVVAATTEGGLGEFASLGGETCRIGGPLLRLLYDGARADFPPGTVLRELGFRVVREGCRSPPTDAQRRELQALLAEVPVCR